MKPFFILLLCLVSYASFAQTRHVVFDMEGTLLVSLPVRFKDASLDKEAFVVIQEAGKTLTYRTYPHTLPALQSLLSLKDISIHIVSRKEDKVLAQILSKITAMDSDKRIKILDQTSFNDQGEFDLSSISTDLKNILFFTASPGALIPSQKSYEIVLPSHYFHESMAQLKSEKKNFEKKSDWKTVHEKFFPKDEAAWTDSYNRLLLIHEKLQDLKSTATLSLTASFNALTDNKPFYKNGLEWVNNNYSSYSYKWVASAGQVTGCTGENFRSIGKVQSFPVSDCAKKLPVFNYTIDQKSCHSFTSNLELIGAGINCDGVRYAVLNPATKKYELKQIDRITAITNRLMKRNASFRKAILSVKGSGMMGELSENRRGCGEEVRRIYKNGGSLYSSLVDTAAKPMSDFSMGSGVQDDTFFHLTASDAYAKTFNVSDQELQKLNGPVEDFFVYSRTKPTELNIGPSHYHSNWGRMFYVSEDTDSLMHWYSGSYGIKFKLDMKARQVTLNRSLFEPAMEEVASRYPGLEKYCGTRFDTTLADGYGTVSYHALVFLIAEESGVDAIYYHQANHWFQILTPEPFLSAELIGKVGGGNNTKGRYSQPDKSYLTTPVLSVISAEFGPNANATDEVARVVDGKTRIALQMSKLGLTGNFQQYSDLTIKYECAPGGVPGSDPKGIRSLKLSASEIWDDAINLTCENP